MHLTEHDMHQWPERSAQGWKIFLRGQCHFSWFFPGVKYFFPVENFHFGSPKTNFSGFEKWKVKTKTKKQTEQKKKRKKKVLCSFWTFFHLQFSIFHLPFSIFLLFSPFSIFFLCSFFPVGQHKFPRSKVFWGALCPACYATGLAYMVFHKNIRILSYH